MGVRKAALKHARRDWFLTTEARLAFLRGFRRGARWARPPHWEPQGDRPTPALVEPDVRVAMIPIESMYLKSLREKLCLAQQAVLDAQLGGVHRPDSVAGALQGLIDGIDAHRPLGPGGKHGTLHTPTCGCPDKRVFTDGT